MKSTRLTGSRRFFRSPAAWVFMSLAFVAAIVCAVAYLLGYFNNPQTRHLRNLAEGYSVIDLEMTGEVSAIAFSPDGKHLVAGTETSGNGTKENWTGDLRVWDTETKGEVHASTCSQWIRSLSFTPDGKYLAVACSSWNTGAPPGFMGFQQKNGEVRIYDFPSMKVWKVLEFNDLVYSAGFSPDGKKLAVSIDSNPKRQGPCELQLLTFPGLEKAMSFTNKRIRPVFAFSLDCTKIFFADTEAMQKRNPATMAFDCETAQLLNTVIGHSWSGSHLECLSDDVLMRVGAGVDFHDIRNGQIRSDMNRQIANRKTARTRIEWATATLDRRYLLAVEMEGGPSSYMHSKVLLEDYQTGELTEVFKETEQNVKFQRCALSPDATRIAVGTGQYVGIRGKHDDPRRGHVLLFEKKAAP